MGKRKNAEASVATLVEPVAPVPAPEEPQAAPSPVAETAQSVETASSFDSPTAAPEPLAAVDPSCGSRGVARRRLTRYRLLAASVALAAAVGALAGGLATATIASRGTSRQGTVAPAASKEIAQLKNSIASLRSQVAALQAHLDKGARGATAQFNKMADHLDRLGRAESERIAKLAQAVEKLQTAHSAKLVEATGSVPPARRALPSGTTSSSRMATLPQPSIASGWRLIGVSGGAALIQHRGIGLIEVERGDIVPGLGRIESIRRQNGRWIVVTARGLIVAPR